MTTRRDPRVPRAKRQTIEVSDSQSVPSHPVWPMRALPVYAVMPKPDPCTVTDVDPVEPPLPRRIVLMPVTSTDHA